MADLVGTPNCCVSFSSEGSFDEDSIKGLIMRHVYDVAF